MPVAGGLHLVVELAERSEVAGVGASARVVGRGVVDLAAFGGPGAAGEPALTVAKPDDDLLQIAGQVVTPPGVEDAPGRVRDQAPDG